MLKWNRTRPVKLSQTIQLSIDINENQNRTIHQNYQNINI